MYKENDGKVVAIVSGGVGFPGLLTAAFIVLRVLGLTNMKWYWIISPLWITWGVCSLVGIVIAIAAFASDSRW